MTARKVRDIDYILLPGTERKTTDIVIERNGVVTVRPPKNLKPDHIDSVVESKRMWIYKNLADWRDKNATRVVRQWVNGESFLYLGRSFRLKLVAKQKEDLKLKDGRFCLRRSTVDKAGEQAAKKVFEEYFTEKGQKRFEERVKYFAPKVGVEPSSVLVKELGYKWGSCSKTGKIAFHWKAMMAKPKVIDYIVVHELCHMHQRDHNDEFWNEVDKVMPDYHERKEWLKMNGANFDL
ncbi:MAG: M48 family metallopeptidase [Bacteroidetes bacterium]|nr:M48 family metallopeptidase [Bacteroidota bacterium]